MAGAMYAAVLKGWDCADHDPIEEWEPDTDTVVYWLTCHIGEPGSPAADLFSVPVVNHLGLHSPAWKQRLRPPRHRDVVPIVVDPYSWDAVLAQVQARILEASSHDWPTVWEELRKRFSWEYEGMSAGPFFDTG